MMFFCYSSNVKFIIVDFEFTKVEGKNLLLVSGAISNSLDKYEVEKLQGHPIVLITDNKLRMFDLRKVDHLYASVRRIFKNRTDLLSSLISQIDQSVNHEGQSSLSGVYISNYLNRANRNPVVVFWNGATDMKIFNGLKIPGKYLYLNLSVHDENNDGTFYLKLVDVNSIITLCSIDLGEYSKNGRLLNLMETHTMMCKLNHNTTHCRDPVADVTLIKCVFSKAVKMIGPIKLYTFYKEQFVEMNKTNYF